MTTPLEGFLHSKVESSQDNLLQSLGVDPAEMQSDLEMARKRGTRTSVGSVLAHQKNSSSHNGANTAA